VSVARENLPSPSSAYLRGRHAIVTGGGRGIGAAIATELAGLGARLTLMGRDALALERHARHLGSEFGAEAAAVRCDVSDPAEVAEAFAAARSEFGDAHVLVNNAGQAEAVPFMDTSRELWDRMLAVNLGGAFLCTQQVLPAMLVAGDGRIINIASTAGLRGYARMSAYCAAKHGVIGLTRSLAIETAKKGVTVNAVCPGYTDTAMAEQAIANLAASRGISTEEALAMLTRVSPRGKLVSPAEVANTVGWLCSPEASAITGQSIAVAGGEVM
jgi:NAD(P)-dependent dehydrogenase (short-subunit alcohol dehydrogenase family)